MSSQTDWHRVVLVGVFGEYNGFWLLVCHLFGCFCAYLGDHMAELEWQTLVSFYGGLVN